MKQRIKDQSVESRYLGISELCSYTNLGKNTAREIGIKSGAVIKYGRRVVYDRERIDTYLGSLAS